VSLVADAAHLAAMSVWLGGLVMLVGVLLRRAGDRELAAILPVWSSWAMMAVVVLALTGTAQAIVEVASPGRLFDTTYGRLVLVKVGLLAMVLVAAWYSRRLVRAPAARALVAAGGGSAADELDDEVVEETAVAPPARLLRRSILVELAITGVVLAVAAARVQTPPARSANATAAEPYSVTLSSDLYKLRFDLDPARVGPNTMHLYAYNQSGQPQAVVEWKATAAPVDGSIEPLDIPMLPITADHAVAQPTFPTAGVWELKFTLRLTDVDQATVSHRVTVKE
jgi:copper transport protein